MEFKYIVAMVLLALLLVIVLPSSANSFMNFYKTSGFFGTTYDSLPSATKFTIDKQFDDFVKNINTCLVSKNQNCICSNLFQYFPDEFSIKITHGQDEIIALMYGKKEIKNQTLNARFAGIYFDSSSPTQTSSKYEQFITFSKGTIYFEGNKVLSNGLYRQSNTLLNIIFYKAKTAFFFGKSESEQMNFVTAIKAC